MNRMLALATGWLACAVAAGPAMAQDARAPLAKRCPPDALAYVEIGNLQPLVRHLPWAAWRKLVEAHPKYREFAESPQKQQAEAGVKFLENTLGMDLPTIAGKLAGTQASLALLPGGTKDEPRVLLWVRFADAELWKKLRGAAEGFLAFAGDKVKKRMAAGKQATAIDGKLHYLVADDTVVFSNHGPSLDAAAALMDGSGAGIAGLPPAPAGENLVGRFWANAKALRAAFPDNYSEKSSNPLGLLLFGDLAQLARKADAFSGRIEATASGTTFALEIPGDAAGLGDLYKAFFATPAEAGVPAAPRVPGYLGGFALKRDLAALYKAKEQLLVESILPEFDKFENGINNLIPGKSFGADLMPLLGKRLTLVAARQDYRDLGGGVPAVKIPAFGLIVELTKPQEGSDILQMFIQAVPTIINFEAKKNGSMPQVLAFEQHKGVAMTFTRYMEKPKGDKLPPIFNLQASSATVGNYWIFASSKQLCRDLIEACQAERPPEAGRNVLFDLSAEGLAKVAEDNADLYMAQQIAEGHPVADAKANWSALVGALGTLSGLKACTECTAKGAEVRVEALFR